MVNSSKKRFAAARNAANVSPSGSSQQSNSPQNGTSAFSSEATAHFSDEDTTPIPSLHGNLVRNRFWRDPLEFYEPLEILGEGSMGSVSKVRKRNEVIGGSARSAYLKTHGKPKGFFGSFFQFLPFSRHNSDASYTFGSGSTNRRTQQQPKQHNCFALFCFPARHKKDSALLDPIMEDDDGADGKKSQDQGCWGAWFGGGATSVESSRHDGSGGKASRHQSFSPKDSFSEQNDDDLLKQEDYEAIERQVQRALKHSTSSLITYGHKDAVYALKSIHLDRVSNSDFMKELKNEVAILKELDHPHIVKCFETFHYNASLFLVLEICSGSDLYSRDPYMEASACTIIRSVLSAVAYMHSKKITHRDLKYENIMFSTQDPDSEVKIIDFGLSKKYADKARLHDCVGTVYTMAPELLTGGYTELVDVWSVGVIAFMLLSSSMPFFGKDRKQVIRRIVKGHYQFISRRWKTVSSGAKAFVVRLLQDKPDKRPSAAEALADPWLRKWDFDCSGFAPEVAMMDKVQATIQTYSGYGKLKKIALMLIAYRSSSEEIGSLRFMWDVFDKKHDGEVTLEEFKAVLVAYEYSDEEFERMFNAMDLDGTGLVHYSEFLAATIESHGSISEEQVAECFDRLDADDSGYITKADIVSLLGGGIPQSYIDDIMAEADIDNDKRISYREFLGLWDQKGDAKMKRDHEDVKKRRHRRADSAMSQASFSSDLSDDEFDDFDINPTFSFEANEIAKMLEAPNTPVSGRRISAVNVFVLEKDKSLRSQSLRNSAHQAAIAKSGVEYGSPPASGTTLVSGSVDAQYASPPKSMGARSIQVA
ncbi:MAP kinase-activated protein kinase 2 (Fragment) [Seminavis robusta]|uniref:MAP kinase-activated protein kinase 2 n=1 Tax=Seminavis robusta TaxID=568900 RepID=A0A9N8HGU8_9STRA